MPLIYGIGHIPGTQTNDAAAAGEVGELLTSAVAVGSAVSVSNNATKTITSKLLTPGNYLVWGVICYVPAASTTVTVLESFIGTTQDSITGVVQPVTILGFPTGTVLGANGFTGVVTPFLLSLAASTTYYLNTYQLFATSTMTAYGSLFALRVR